MREACRTNARLRWLVCLLWVGLSGPSVRAAEKRESVNLPNAAPIVLERAGQRVQMRGLAIGLRGAAGIAPSDGANSAGEVSPQVSEIEVGRTADAIEFVHA